MTANSDLTVVSVSFLPSKDHLIFVLQFKQELDMSVNTDPYEVKDLTENGENRVGPSVMEEEDKKNGHGKEESKKASKLQSNENLGYTKTLNIPFAVYAAIKKCKSFFMNGKSFLKGKS